MAQRSSQNALPHGALLHRARPHRLCHGTLVQHHACHSARGGGDVCHSTGLRALDIHRAMVSLRAVEPATGGRDNHQLCQLLPGARTQRSDTGAGSGVHALQCAVADFKHRARVRQHLAGQSQAFATATDYRLHLAAAAHTYHHNNNLRPEHLRLRTDRPLAVVSSGWSDSAFSAQTDALRAAVVRVYWPLRVHAQYQGEAEQGHRAGHHSRSSHAAAATFLRPRAVAAHQLQRHLRLVCRSAAVHAVDADLLVHLSVLCRA